MKITEMRYLMAVQSAMIYLHEAWKSGRVSEAEAEALETALWSASAPSAAEPVECEAGRAALERIEALRIDAMRAAVAR
jgi:hypothetical protein